jgi:hypothetical protein
MRKILVLLLLMTIAVWAPAATKDTGSTTLKDVQPAGQKAKKHKQQYDLMFISSTGKDYTCRTSEKKDVKATDLHVGSSVTYEVKDTKGKVKTAEGKSFSCTIVRVANAPTMKQ